MKTKSAAFFEKLKPVPRRLLGVGLALLSGCLYGTNFNPPEYLMNHGSDNDPLDYVFSHFCGIYLASTTWFLVYCIFQRNQPLIYPRAILPGFLSGLMWGIAETSWFVANGALGMTVTIPICSAGPALIGILWGVFLFKEITGLRNFLILGVAFVFGITGTILISLSKIK